MIQAADISKIVLPGRVNLFSKAQPRALWAVGNAQIVRRPLLGIVSARKIDPDLALKSDELMQQLARLNQIAFIGGWHSQLEKQSLRLLQSREAFLVVCLAKALDRFKPAAELKELVSRNKVLLLTHCTPNAKRISRGASIRRNELVIELAAFLLVLSAPEESESFKLARAALDGGKPVFTLDHHLNRRLLDCGASVASFDHISTAFR
jgi:predicted Rossmann fold nucleotide-binding protein DprA/Smf involved in DNA uptake